MKSISTDFCINIYGAVFTRMSYYLNKQQSNHSPLSKNLIPSIHHQTLDAVKVLCLMSIFSFFSFAFVDPLITSQSLFPLFLTRGIAIFIALSLLGLCYTRISVKHAHKIGASITLITGFSVVILTELTGGADSFYWTMLLLTYFTVTVMLPMTPFLATVYFGSITIFFDLWMLIHDATGSDTAWIASNAGIWLSTIICILTVRFIHTERVKKIASDEKMIILNQKLLLEIEERKQLENSLKQAQKLEAIGQIASGFAHEMNNILTTIICSAELVENHRLNQEKFTVNLEHLKRANERGSKLVRDLLGFARKGPLTKNIFEIHETIDNVIDLFQGTYRGKITIQKNLTNVPAYILGDSQLFFQIIFNLILNSIDAMDGDGIIYIETKSIIQKTNQIEIKITDTGHGMTPEVLSKVFEPFFSTKPPGKGTGLGLSMAYGTLQDHDGSINLESEPNLGTTVIMTIPTIQKPVESVSIQTKEEIKQNPYGNLMLIDDDEKIRNVIREILELSDFRVLSFSNGKEALESYMKMPKKIDLVILDMMMPEMSGKECFQEIRTINPQQKICICSGYIEEPAQNDLELIGEHLFIRKPFHPREFITQIISLVHSSQ